VTASRVLVRRLGSDCTPYADVPTDRIHHDDDIHRQCASMPVTAMCGATLGRHDNQGPPVLVDDDGKLSCPKCIKILRRLPADAVDAAAWSILAARAEQPVEEWDLAGAVGELADVGAVQARLAECAGMIRAGALNAAKSR